MGASAQRADANDSRRSRDIALYRVLFCEEEHSKDTDLFYHNCLAVKAFALLMGTSELDYFSSWIVEFETFLRFFRRLKNHIGMPVGHMYTLQWQPQLYIVAVGSRAWTLMNESRPARSVGYHTLKNTDVAASTVGLLLVNESSAPRGRDGFKTCQINFFSKDNLSARPAGSARGKNGHIDCSTIAQAIVHCYRFPENPNSKILVDFDGDSAMSTVYG
ncbi:hypothetical protein EVAR_46119_1 [Eumeta japonica]|uniref:Uncharacterized protein n=1 Tax=Eumeta variegata TaxID=151549 RepID=A0A4C1XRB8_EUMVA|nr:hypothetical protein EVAR_46119_1 [Eumeta japonica]